MFSCQWRHDYTLLWSHTVSLDYCREEMLEQIKTGTRHPINVKIWTGKTSKVERFQTAEEVIAHLVRTDPRAKALRDHAHFAKEMLAIHELALVQAQETEKLIANSVMQAESSGSQLMDWMYADAITGVISHYDPLRWRTGTKGAITLSAAISEFKHLADKCKAREKPQRPVIVKIPPGLTSEEKKFDDFDEVIKFLKAEIGDEDSRRNHTVAKRCLADAEKQVAEARITAEEAEAAAAAVTQGQ